MRNIDVRKKIINGAIKLFMQKGFFETTVDDIAHAAKIAKGTVYLYFKDKPSLYVSIIDEHFITAFKFLKEVAEENLTNAEKLRKITDNWLNYMLKLKHEYPMYSVENVSMTQKIMKGIHPRIFSHLEEMIKLITQIIEKGINDGEFRKIDAHIGAVYFLNTIRTAYFLHVFYPTNRNSKKDIDDILFLGLKRR